MPTNPRIPVRIKPIAVTLVTADSVRRGPSGKYVIDGVFDAIRSRRFPATHPPFGVFLILTEGYGTTPITLRLVEVDDDTDALWQRQIEVKFKSPIERIQIGLEVPSIKFPRPRMHQLQVVCDGDVLLDTPINLRPDTDADSDTGLGPDFLAIAVMQAWLGQEKKLTATCKNVLKHVKNTTNPALAERAAKICSLRPMGAAIQESALALARRAVDRGQQSPYYAFFQMALGMAEYRVGNYEKADAALLEASQLGASAPCISGTAAFYRAMSLWRQGKESEGRKLAAAAMLEMKPLPVDERNPLVDETNVNDFVLWMAYKEAEEILGLSG